MTAPDEDWIDSDDPPTVLAWAAGAVLIGFVVLGFVLWFWGI